MAKFYQLENVKSQIFFGGFAIESYKVTSVKDIEIPGCPEFKKIINVKVELKNGTKKFEKIVLTSEEINVAENTIATYYTKLFNDILDKRANQI